MSIIQSIKGKGVFEIITRRRLCFFLYFFYLFQAVMLLKKGQKSIKTVDACKRKNKK